MRTNKSMIKKIVSIILLKATLLTSVSTVSAVDTEKRSKKTENLKSEVSFREEYDVKDIIFCTFVSACILSFTYRGKCTSSSFSLNNAACQEQEEKLTSITQTAPNVSNELFINNRLTIDATKSSSEVIEEMVTTPNNTAGQEEENVNRLKKTDTTRYILPSDEEALKVKIYPYQKNDSDSDCDCDCDSDNDDSDALKSNNANSRRVTQLESHVPVINNDEKTEFCYNADNESESEKRVNITG